MSLTATTKKNTKYDSSGMRMCICAAKGATQYANQVLQPQQMKRIDWPYSYNGQIQLILIMDVKFVYEEHTKT